MTKEMFRQIGLLIILGILIMLLMKFGNSKCPIISKYVKTCSSGTCAPK